MERDYGDGVYDEGGANDGAGERINRSNERF